MRHLRDTLYALAWCAGLLGTAQLEAKPVEDYDCTSGCHEIGTTPASETNISTVNSTWFESCVEVNGTLFVNQNTVLDEAHLVMNSASSIVVESGFYLFLLKSHLNGCDELWRGITVESGARLYVYYDTIQDADAAIFLENRATVIAYNSRFENNYIGICTAFPYDGFIAHKELSGSISGCDFVNTASLLDPYSGHHYSSWPTGTNIPYDRDYAGVYLRKCAGLNVGVTSALASARNYFEGLRNGVVLDTVIANVGYCDIQDLVGVQSPSADPITDLEDLSNSGIFAVCSAVTCNDNDIDGIQDGIVFNNCSGLINDNAIEMNTDISVSYRATITRGISAFSSTMPLRITANVVQEANIGILLGGGFTPEVQVDSNSISTIVDWLDPLLIRLSLQG